MVLRTEGVRRDKGVRRGSPSSNRSEAQPWLMGAAHYAPSLHTDCRTVSVNGRTVFSFHLPKWCLALKHPRNVSETMFSTADSKQPSEAVRLWVSGTAVEREVPPSLLYSFQHHPVAHSFSFSNSATVGEHGIQPLSTLTTVVNGEKQTS